MARLKVIDVGAILIAAGCSSTATEDVSKTRDPLIDTLCPLPQAKVTGKSSSDPTWTTAQSETAMSVGQYLGVTRAIVQFNDDTGDDGTTIIYSQTSRTVYSGASEMGWAYSADRGNSWTYGGKIHRVWLPS